MVVDTSEVAVGTSITHPSCLLILLIHLCFLSSIIYHIFNQMTICLQHVLRGLFALVNCWVKYLTEYFFI